MFAVSKRAFSKKHVSQSSNVRVRLSFNWVQTRLFDQGTSSTSRTSCLTGQFVVPHWIFPKFSSLYTELRKVCVSGRNFNTDLNDSEILFDVLLTQVFVIQNSTRQEQEKNIVLLFSSPEKDPIRGDAGVMHFLGENSPPIDSLWQVDCCHFSHQWISVTSKALNIQRISRNTGTHAWKNRKESRVKLSQFRIKISYL